MELKITWKLLSTPSPDDLGFQTFHDPDNFIYKTTDGNDGWPIEGTTIYGNWWAAEQPKCKSSLEWGTYVLGDEEITQEGVIVFTWHKNKTAEEMNTPFRRYSRLGNHRWPPILVDVSVLPDYGSPRNFPIYSGTDIGVGFGPSYNDQLIYIPDASEGTRFVTEEFFAAVPFNIPQYPTPVATAVTYRLPGGETRSFPECLHDTLCIPPLITAQTSIVAGVAGVIGTTIPEQIFPATNFVSWAPYVLSDSQERRDGGWYRVRVRVYPPPVPDVVQLVR